MNCKSIWLLRSHLIHQYNPSLNIYYDRQTQLNELVILCFQILSNALKHVKTIDFIFAPLTTQINAGDEDFGDFGTCSYDIFSDEMKESFTIDKVKGEIVTKVRLDREERRTYEIPVIATDGGGRSGFTTVKLKVGDLNDNAPVFHLHEYKTAIYANTTVNTTFMKVNYGFCLSFLSVFSDL